MTVFVAGTPESDNVDLVLIGGKVSKDAWLLVNTDAGIGIRYRKDHKGKFVTDQNTGDDAIELIRGRSFDIQYKEPPQETCRYTLICDNFGDYYVIPEDKRETWLNTRSTYEDEGAVPDWAQPVGSTFTFTDPKA